MEHHQEVEGDNRNEKEEIVSTSPDSGINFPDEDEKNSEKNSIQNDTDSGKSSPSDKRIQCTQSVARNTLYPFYYKYPDNRKLALLKSLSQDSEYSLDTSLFDAEDFLQEMGFAGSTGPIIPDRFLPSLIQRLSKFPESEMESLNDRIIQSIGCFKRKEGKRRLFRNLSMGKESPSDQADGRSLPCLNSYPLLRSNTGPASFSFDDTLPINRSSNISRCSKLMSDTSNNSSFAEDDFLPESPIAILVSSASVDTDQEDKVSPSIFENKKPCGDDSSNFFEIPAYGILEDPYQSKEKKRDYGIHQISPYPSKNEDKALKESSQQNESIDLIYSSQETKEEIDPALMNGEEKSSVRDEKRLSEVQEKIKHETLTAEISNDEFGIETSVTNESNSISSSVCLPPNTDSSIVFKQPLRRLTQSPSQNIRNSVDPRAEQTNTDLFDSQGSCSYYDSISKTIDPFNEMDVKHQFFAVNNSSFENTDSSTSVSEKEDLEFLEGTIKEEIVLKTTHETSILEKSASSEEFQIKTKSYQREKPKYTRDDSLTNFLSSMLDTNENSLSSVSPTTSHTFNFDARLENNQDNSKTKDFCNSLSQNESNETSSISPCRRTQNSVNHDYESTKPHIQKEKTPSRKRRILRRMSSSFNYVDDEGPPKASENVDAQESSSFNYLSTPFVNCIKPKLQLQNSLSAPLGSNCPIMYPCCCLPTVNLCTYRGLHYENKKKYCEQTSSNNKGNEKYENSQFPPFKRRSNRNYKRGRYLSCPESLKNANCKVCNHVHSLSNSIQNLNAYSQNHLHSPSLPLYSSCCNFQFCRDHHSQFIVNSSFCHGGYSSEPQKASNIYHKSEKPSSNIFDQQSDIFSPYNINNIKVRRAQWSSTPDVRFNYPNKEFVENQKRCNANFFPNEAPFHPFSFVSDKRDSSDDVFLPKSKTHSSSAPKQVSNHSKLKQKESFKEYQKSGVSINTLQKDVYCLPNDSHHLSFDRKELNDYFPPASQYLDGESTTKRYLPLKACNSYPLHKRDSSDEKHSLQNRRFSWVEQSSLQDHAHQHNIKREAFMEKKIRVFSKFLTNLGNLSKSIPDIKDNSNQVHSSLSKNENIMLPDNKSEFHLYNDQDERLRSDNSQTSSPEFGKLLKLLNSIDLDKNSKSLNQKSRFTEFNKEQGNISKKVIPIYENSVSLELVDSDQGSSINHFSPVSYTSSISLNVIDDNEISMKSFEKETKHKSTSAENRGKLERTNSFHNYPMQMSFKEVSKELEELQMSIQKAKEMRMSASKELHLLQELLSKDFRENSEIVDARKNFSVVQEEENPMNDEESFEALTDLRKKSHSDSDDATFWQEEIKKIKEENDAKWQIKLERMEKRLAAQEEELRLVQSTNEGLQKQLELQSALSNTCHCKGDALHNGIGRIDSAFEDDEEYLTHKSSISIHSSRQECERLQEQLIEAEQRADQLNLLLNQKLIEMNKLQLTLSKQTKEMIELEKSYLQLQYRLRKGTSKPTVAKLCSRTSPFNSKNLCPKPSPPASPHPNGIS